MRTDNNRNPIACTTDLAKQAGLVLGIDYERGDVFPNAGNSAPLLYTAKFLLDPVDTSIRVIDAVGYYTKAGGQRWVYIAMPAFVWTSLSHALKVSVIAYHYSREGGNGALNPYFNSVPKVSAA